MYTRAINKYLILTAVVMSLAIMNVSAQNTGGAADQASIGDQVAKKLNRLPHYGVFDHITYSVSGNTVVLNGKVHSLGTIGQAISAVKKIPGVSNVVNNIDELPPSSNDDSIRQSTLKAFANRGSLYRYFFALNPEVRIIVDNGHVTLEGTVANRSDATTMKVLANGISGVFSVDDNLVIGRGRS